MINNVLFLIFLLAHIIGDFYLQTENIAKRKKKEFLWVIFHSALYSLSFVLVGIIIPTIETKYLITLVAAHAAIDIAKYFIQNKIVRMKECENESKFFIIDQVLHILIIFAVLILNQESKLESNLLVLLNDYMEIIGISGVVAMNWTLKLLLIHKPMNIFISSTLSRYKPTEKKSRIKEEKNAGRFIGTLERTIILIFISIEQYSAVGLVLTAKSIARYDKISKDQEFAEYYLLGTLLSTICAILVSVLF